MHNSFCPRSLYHINLDSALARRNHFCGAKAGSLIVIWMCTMIKTNQLPIYLMLTPEGFVIIVFPIPVFWDASPFPSMQHGEYQLQYVPKQYHIFTNTWALVLVWLHLEICCVCSIVDVSNLWIATAFWRLRFQHFFFLFLRSLLVDPVHYARNPHPLDQQNKLFSGPIHCS